MIIAGSASQALAATLAAELDWPLAEIHYERFPDDELLPTVADLNVSSAVVVAATVTSDAHIELLLLQDVVREAGITDLTTVIPYMGYARQDKAFEPGQPVSARAIARAISSGTDRIVTVNPHEQYVCDFFTVPSELVDASGILAEPLPADLDDPVFLSPDAGAIDLAESVRDAYGEGTVDHFEKTRKSGTSVEIVPSKTDVSGRDVVVVDDIIATGSTMSEAITVLGEHDIGRVFVTCVHAMLTGNAMVRLSRAGVEAIYGTDTIERSVSAVSVAPIIANALVP